MEKVLKTTPLRVCMDNKLVFVRDSNNNLRTRDELELLLKTLGELKNKKLKAKEVRKNRIVEMKLKAKESKVGQTVKLVGVELDKEKTAVVEVDKFGKILSILSIVLPLATLASMLISPLITPVVGKVLTSTALIGGGHTALALTTDTVGDVVVDHVMSGEAVTVSGDNFAVGWKRLIDKVTQISEYLVDGLIVFSGLSFLFERRGQSLGILLSCLIGWWIIKSHDAIRVFMESIFTV